MNPASKVYIANLLDSVKPYRRRIIAGLVATVFASIAESASPMLLKYGIDALQAGKPDAWLWGLSGLIILVSAIGGIFRFQMRNTIIGVSRWIEADLRENFFMHLLRLPPAFFDRNHTGDLMARSTEDVERVRMVAGPGLLYTANTQLTLLFSAAMMLYVDYKLAALLLSLTPLVGGAMLWVARALHKASMRQQEVFGELTTVVQENVSGARVIKSYAREDYEAGRFAEVCGRYFRRSLRVAQIQALMFPLITFLIGLGVAGILWIGGSHVALSSMSLGDFIAFMGYLSLMTWPMIALGWVVHLYQRGAASHERLNQVLEVPRQFSNDNDYDSSVVQSDSKAPKISFKNASLRYRPEGSDVITDLSLEIPAGKTLAIIGQTGSGKSSVARMLLRLYEPHNGVIYIDGTLWNSIPVDQLRVQIAYVDQTPFIFSTEIDANLRLGKPDATQKEIESAAKSACFDADISEFPDRYKTMLGERGVTLSGGQQQRLTLARALLLGAPVLVLDDALSAVDSDTEAEIIRQLKGTKYQRTTIIITHRLAVVEEVDLVAVLDKGKLVEFGEPADLLKNGSYFADMFRRQRLAEEIEGV